jgi:hypothetical protein
MKREAVLALTHSSENAAHALLGLTGLSVFLALLLFDALHCRQKPRCLRLAI